MKRLALLAALLSLGTLSAAHAANDRLEFADMGGILDFRPDGAEGIFIEGRNHQWYHASFYAPCYDLRFHDRVGFVLEPTNSLDRFSSILVGGRQCYFKSFERTDEPK